MMHGQKNIKLAFNSALLTNLLLKCISVKRLHEWSFTSALSQAMRSWHTLG